MTSIFTYRVLADAVVYLHFAFILFVILGGIFVIFRPKILWLHIPCVIWGMVIELAGFICPLTPLENYLRVQARQTPYSGDFVIHYIEPVIYPEGLTRELQIVLGLVVVIVNAFVYAWLFLRKKRPG
ncbi:MAG: DUF2784 domain-containing protein [Desulfomonilia bacterium]